MRRLKAFISTYYKYILVLLAGFSLWFYFCLPNPLFSVSYSMVVEDEKGELLSAKVANDEQWRFPAGGEWSDKFEQCILYFEDEYFYQHPGINPISIGKATYQNIKAGRVIRGGSTISMQVIRLSRKGQPRTVFEKIYESLLALRLELRYSKKEILAMYIQHAPFGGNIVGLEAAAWRYYGRKPSQLSWGEAATLAVLPNAPALIFPGRNHESLLKKRNRLLDKLRIKGVIDETVTSLAQSEPIPSGVRSLPSLSPHVLAYFKKEYPLGNRIKTTLIKSFQQQISQVVQQYAQQYRQNELYNMAALVVETKTGRVISYVGNVQDQDNANENAVDIIRSARSSGSTLKPFLYERMQANGALLPATLLPDIPTYISGYAPKNFDEKFDGAVPANQALARSLNIPAVRMLQDYGIDIWLHDLQQLGFNTINRSADNYGLTLVLGGAEVTLWDLVQNYRKLGISVLKSIAKPDEINQIHLSRNSSNKNLNYLPDPAASWLTLEALKNNDRPVEGIDWRRFASAKRIAWKTGTSFGHKDAWSIGVTPDYVVGIWVGNADGEGRPGLTGASTAAPVMFDIFKLLPGKSWFDQPELFLSEYSICRQSGYRASSSCSETVKQMIHPNGERTAVCPFHRLVYLDKQEAHQVTGNCYPVVDMIRKPWFVLPPLMERYYKTKNPFYEELPPLLASCFPIEQNIELIYPQPQAKLFIPKSFEGQKESLVFQATHRKHNAVIHWHIDDRYVQSTQVNHQIELQPLPGAHVVTLVADNGETIQRSFEVLHK